jgi:hypothetical protein
MSIVLKSRSLNLLEPSRPLQACNGIALPITILYLHSPLRAAYLLVPLRSGECCWQHAIYEEEDLSIFVHAMRLRPSVAGFCQQRMLSCIMSIKTAGGSVFVRWDGCGIWKEVLSWHLPGRHDKMTGNISKDRRYAGTYSSSGAVGGTTM